MPRKYALTIILLLTLSTSSQAISRSNDVNCSGFLVRVIRFLDSGKGFPDYEKFPEAAPLMIGIPPGISLDWDTLEHHIRDLFETPRAMDWSRFLSWPLRRQYTHFGNILNQYIRNMGERIQIGWSYEGNTGKIRVRVCSELGLMVVLEIQEYPLAGINYYICTGIRAYTGWEPSPDEPETVPLGPELSLTY